MSSPRSRVRDLKQRQNDGPGPVVHPTVAPKPTLPLSVISVNPGNPPTTHSPTPTTQSPPVPSSSSLSSLSWAFVPISDATTCSNVSIDWDVFNPQSDISAIIASTGSQDLRLTFTLSGLGSSTAASPLQFDGSAQDLIGSQNGVQWFVDIPPGMYGISGVLSLSANPTSAGISPSIETAFIVHQGDDVSCLAPSSSGAPASGTGSASSGLPSSSSASSSSSSSSSKTGAIVGGIIGGLLLLALWIVALLFFRQRRHRSKNNSPHHRRHITPSRLRAQDRQSFDHPQGSPRGWTGLASRGSLSSTLVATPAPSPTPFPTPAVLMHEKGIPSPLGTDHFFNKNLYTNSVMLGQELCSPPGSLASVELAHLPSRGPVVGSVVTATPTTTTTPTMTRKSMTGSTVLPPDPFATPLPGTPLAVSERELGHGHARGARGGSSPSDFEADSDSSHSYSQFQSHSRSHSNSTTRAFAGAGAPTPVSFAPVTKRLSYTSHHSRKPVPAYGDLNLTDEEKLALGSGSGSGSGTSANTARTTRPLPTPIPIPAPRPLPTPVPNNNTSTTDLSGSDEYDSQYSPATTTPYQHSHAHTNFTQPSVYSQGSGPSPISPAPTSTSTITPPKTRRTRTSYVGHSNTNSNNNAAGEEDHEHALELLRNLRSKSSGHMKGDAFVHYVYPDPPLDSTEG